MPADINYKKKYLELRTKYMGDIDIAFRLGMEQGMQQAQQQQALDAQAQANEKEMQMQQMQAQASGQPPEEGGGGGFPAGGEAPGQPGQPGQPSEGGAPPGGAPTMEQPGQNGSELDQHINKLEGMLGTNSDPEVKKSLDAILSLRKAEKQAVELKKSQQAIAGIAKALHKPAFKVGVTASHNLSENAKKAVGMQHKIVTDIMKKWEHEEKTAASSLENILNVENLLKKE